MENNNLNIKEQAIKDILEDVQFDINTTDLWDQIEDRIPTDNNNKKMLWRWLIGIAFISSIMGSYYMGYRTVNNDTDQKKISSKQQQPILSTTKKYSKNNLKTAPSININHEKNQSKEATPKVINEQNSINNTSTRTSQALSDIVDNSDMKIKDNKDLFNSNSITNSKNKYNIQKKTSPEVFKPVVQALSFILPTTVYTRKQEKNQASETIKLPLISLNIFDYLRDDLTISNEKLILSKTISTNNWKPYFAIATGINRNQGRYQSNTLENKNNLFSKEKGVYGSSSELIYGRINRNGWEWHTGIGYQLIASRFNNQDKLTAETIINGTTKTHIDSDGNQRNTTGPIIKTLLKQYDITWHRQHHILDLRVGLGKRLFEFRRFNIGVRSGMAYSIMSNHKGYYFENGKNDITKISSSDHPYRPNGIFKYYGGVSLGYHWNQYDLRLHTNYTSDINSATRKTNYYSLKNSQYGIQFSILYRPY